jgi:uncharacterized repeat protein (TIGR01451 family)
VNAPTSAFQESGTSQATPHVTGSVAVLHARYPAETPAEILSRMRASGVTDTDSAANGRATPRVNLLAAFNLGTAISISGSGPTTATAGKTGTYTITVTNNGPLDATTVKLTDMLPSNATFTSASSGCSFSTPYVTCSLGTLATNASITITINVTWTTDGSVYDAAAVSTDQANTSSQQTLAIGTPPVVSEAPLPLWAYALLGIALILLGWRKAERGATA